MFLTKIFARIFLGLCCLVVLRCMFQWKQFVDIREEEKEEIFSFFFFFKVLIPISLFKFIWFPNRKGTRFNIQEEINGPSKITVLIPPLNFAFVFVLLEPWFVPSFCLLILSPAGRRNNLMPEKDLPYHWWRQDSGVKVYKSWAQGGEFLKARNSSLPHHLSWGWIFSECCLRTGIGSQKLPTVGCSFTQSEECQHTE